MRKREAKKAEPWFDRTELEASLALSPEQRLRYLEELNKFLDAFTPRKNKQIWAQMKKRGW